jgi:acetolactate synthase regulatory subunit
MVKLNVIKGYYDIKLGRKIEVGEILEVDNERALELLQSKTKVVDVLEISKLSSKKNEAIVSSKKRK